MVYVAVILLYLQCKLGTEINNMVNLKQVVLLTLRIVIRMFLFLLS